MNPHDQEVAHRAKTLNCTHHGSFLENTDTPRRVTINNLPPEIIVNIIRCLWNNLRSHWEHTRTLYQLSLCCRYLHGLVEPILYERCNYFGSNPIKPFRLFLTRILARPDLGKWIRTLCVWGTTSPKLGRPLYEDENGQLYEDEYGEEYREMDDEDYQSNFKVSGFTAESLKAIRKQIAEVGTTASECYKWAVGIEEGDLNATIALILTLAPNLQELDIEIWTRQDPEPSFLTRMLSLIEQLQREKQLGNPLALWGLKKVEVRYNHELIDTPIHDLMSLLMISSVESLSVTDKWTKVRGDDGGSSAVNVDIDEDRLEAALHGSNKELANMKTLSLSSITMDPKTLFRLFRCYPNLKSLYYNDRSEDDGFEDANLLAEASRLNPCLQNLTILHEGHNWSSIMTSSTGSLDLLKSLRYLKTNWKSLIHSFNTYLNEDFRLGQSILDDIPSSLERLSLLGANDLTVEHQDMALAVIFKIVQQKRRFPALKSLDVGWKHGGYLGRGWLESSFYRPVFTEEDCQTVPALCEEAGVEMVLRF